MEKQPWKGLKDEFWLKAQFCYSVPMCIYRYQVNADLLSILFFVLFSTVTNLIRHSNKKNLSADIYEGQTMVKKYNASIFSAQ